ncbi:hypothetical protein H6F62_07525 [Anabaena sp. FACHB-1391]|uniref:hypothetical protein n=1 Tax=Anabaena sp. FACHB-1391 TaxID=2692771 RepID=UPI00168014B8|nr:hypothetical protein [Anabaena sp. FACHB-1391]MBD2268619.1 hypothetical protein [Anabaena sp. FACHB-1391]
MPKSKTDFTNFVDARPNYFPGQFLLEDDFEVEQKYLIDRQKYHRQSLHVSGLVEGLEVEVIKDKQEVQIKSGSGINSNGDLIILKKDTSFSKFAPLTNGELYISYKEEKQVKQQEDFTRWQEVPTIGFAATTPNDGVKLAKISIVNNVLTLDLTVRDYSGIFLPNATGNDLTLRSGGNANPNVAILNGSLTVTGTITGNIDATNINSGVLAVERIPNLSADKITSGTISGNLTVTNVLKIGQDATGGTRDWMTRGISILSDSDNLFIGLKDEGSNREDAVIAWGDDPQDDLRFIHVLSGGAANGTEIMRLKPSGNVGIGTVTPSEKLEVSGNLKVTGSLTAGNKITVPGNQKIEFSDTDITNNLKLQLWTGYGLGINGGTLFYAANGKHSWRDNNGNNERMALTTGADGSLTVNGTGTSSFAGNLKVNNVFLGDLGHGSGWAGFSHSSQAGLNSYALLQNSTGTYTLINKKAGDGYIGFRVDNNDRMVINSNGNVGIGTTTPSEKLEVSGNLRVTGTITGNINASNINAGVLDIARIPTLDITRMIIITGMIVMWSGDEISIPGGWALCDGQAGRPDLRGRFILGSGQGNGLTNRTKGMTGGVERHTLTVAEMPAHNHGITDPGHSHRWTASRQLPGTDDGNYSSELSKGDSGTGETMSKDTTSVTTGISIQNNGSGQSHENMPPFYVLAFIIKLP